MIDFHAIQAISNECAVVIAEKLVVQSKSIKQTNTLAMRLYDQVAARSGFVVYRRGV